MYLLLQTYLWPWRSLYTQEPCSRRDGRFMYWQRINTSGVAPHDLSPERNQLSQSRQATITIYQTMLFNKLVVSSLCWPLTLLHHIPNRLLAILSHVSSISAGFQLPPPTPTKRPGPASASSFPCLALNSKPVPGSSGSRQLPMLLLGTSLLCFVEEAIYPGPNLLCWNWETFHGALELICQIGSLA